MHATDFCWCKALMLCGYYHANWPARFARNRAAASAGEAPIPILFYHRVADDRANSCTISNDNFETQIRWLRRSYEIISLDEARKKLAGEAQPSRRLSVSITFDDGHADNCERAIPLLVKLNIPCTYFVTVDHVMNGKRFAFDGERPNTPQQVRAMAAAGIEIGAHTATHPDLGKIRDRRGLEREIVDSARRLEDLIGKRVRYFAFPFGSYSSMNSTAFQIARDAGFEAVCSAYGGYNLPGDDPFHLQRIHADPGMIRLKNRVSIDPRMARVPRFQAALGQARD